MTMRVYVPATWPMLCTLVEAASRPDRRHRVRAHPPAARALHERRRRRAGVRRDDRGRAGLAAPAGHLELCLGPDGMPARRVVVAADLEDVTLRPDLDDGAVRDRELVPLEEGRGGARRRGGNADAASNSASARASDGG